MNMFEDWTKQGSAYRNGNLYGVEIEAKRLSETGGALGTSVIYLAGDNFGDDFYTTWNGEASVRLRVDGDVGVLAVMEMARPGDDYGGDEGVESDTPTLAWKINGDRAWLIGSRSFMDADVTEALGIEWPKREEFERFEGIQGWGE
ncbi:hypothetical protein EA187_03555 [Lujinxingia sediminis]|uniref:Uncharacterized protein n=1 Tax=Lujinxingia sediminis TaxID=2480984 RepID=A0ABY0CXB1_9DELT|nr:hypothetical protein [Lujinxingia sediminis]RVU48522.1 hypothetical protein EA187_03555 [Lujinxingia sediminis]